MTTCKVISLFDKKTPLKEEESTEVSETFEEEVKRNEANKERLRKERLNANKGVLRSYRIKP